MPESDKDRRAFQEAMGFGQQPDAPRPSVRRASPRGLLGLSAPQRLLLALLLLFAVCVLGTMCLLATGRISAF